MNNCGGMIIVNYKAGLFIGQPTGRSSLMPAVAKEGQPGSHQPEESLSGDQVYRPQLELIYA